MSQRVSALLPRGVTYRRMPVFNRRKFGCQFIRTFLNYDSVTGNAPATKRDDRSLYPGWDVGTVMRFFQGYNAAISGATGLCADASGALNTLRMSETQYNIAMALGAGMTDIVLTLTGVSAGGQDFLGQTYTYPATAALTTWSNFLANYLPMLPQLPQGCRYIITPSNEPVVLFPPATYLAASQRVLMERVKQQNRTDMWVGSHETQGGERDQIYAWWGADASGPSINGSTGSGTRGEQYFDVIVHHAYYSGLDTLAQTLAADSHLGLNFARSAMAAVQSARLARAANSDGGRDFWRTRTNRFTGQLEPRPEHWNTEYNVNAVGSSRNSNTDFGWSGIVTPADTARITDQMLFGPVSAGWDVNIPYAIDHLSAQLGVSMTSASNGAGGTRFTHAASVLNGDTIIFQGGTLQGAQARATYIDATHFDLAIPYVVSTGLIAQVLRYTLGYDTQAWALACERLVGAQFAGHVLDGTADTKLIYRNAAGTILQTNASGVFA